MSEDPFLAGLQSMIRAGEALPEPDAAYLPSERGATGAAAELLDAIARHRVHLELGWRRVWDSPSRAGKVRFHDFAQSFEVCGLEPPFDPAHGLVLGASAGGEVVFGFAWDGGGLRFVEVDLEEALIDTFPTATAFFEHVAAYEKSRGDALTPHLTELFARAGRPQAKPPVTAGPVPRLEVVSVEMPHPLAAATAQFGGGYLLESAPTPAGRRLLV